MASLGAYQREMRRLDELSGQDTPIHALHPLTKLLTTVFFLFAVLSCPAAEIFNLLPFFVYPLFVAVAGNIPLDFLFWRVSLAAPFVFCIALTGLFFASWAVMANMILKFLLAVTAGALLLATTGLAALSQALYRLPLPRLFIQQLLFLYRYIHILLLEVGQTVCAYSLRSSGRGLRREIWPALLGQLLIRTIQRCQNIHQAMLCRGFTGCLPTLGGKPAASADLIYLAVFCALFLFTRFYLR